MEIKDWHKKVAALGNEGNFTDYPKKEGDFWYCFGLGIGLISLLGLIVIAYAFFTYQYWWDGEPVESIVNGSRVFHGWELLWNMIYWIFTGINIIVTGVLMPEFLQLLRDHLNKKFTGEVDETE